MADAGQQAVDFGVNTGAGMAARAILNRSIPLPDFYNPNSPNHFADSQAGQMLHGNGRAWGRFGLHQGGRLAGAALGNLLLPGFGGMLGGMAGGWLADHFGPHDSPPTGTVGGSPATVTSNSATSGDVSIDPWTGQQISGGAGLPNYMPDFTGGAGYSNFGPYAGGYQGLPDQSGGGNATMPDFSGYSDQFMQDADQNGDGRLNPSERRDAMANGYGPSGNVVPGLYGVSNMIANGNAVINGVRPAGGDMNGLAMYNGRDWGG